MGIKDLDLKRFNSSRRIIFKALDKIKNENIEYNNTNKAKFDSINYKEKDILSYNKTKMLVKNPLDFIKCKNIEDISTTNDATKNSDSNIIDSIPKHKKNRTSVNINKKNTNKNFNIKKLTNMYSLNDKHNSGSNNFHFTFQRS